MTPAFFDLPETDRFALRNVRVPSCLLLGKSVSMSGASVRSAEELTAADLLIEHGVLVGIEHVGGLPVELGPDLKRSMVLPGMVDCHTHLDKGHIWPRKPNPTGDVPGASLATAEDRVSRWTAEDLRRRMEFALMTAYAKGVVAIRTHLDSQAPQADISFPVFTELRERWAGRIELQVSSIVPLDIFFTDEGRALADLVAATGGQLGCVTRFKALSNAPFSSEFDDAMTRVFGLAQARGLDLDLHVDETGDTSARTLLRVAELARDLDFGGRILCGHCCSLALHDESAIAATLDACVDARIDVVSLPTVNLYLQARAAGITPRWRGVTLLHEMKARGLRVAVAGDNCRDPFYAYGDHDMLDTFTQAVKILQLDHPLGDWIAAATSTPADIIGLREGQGSLRVGKPADLIVLKARNYSEMLSRVQSDRVVLRHGKQIDTRLPDYAVLDDLMDESS